MARLLVRASSNNYQSGNTLGITGFPFAIMGRIRLTSTPAADMVIAGLFKNSGGGNDVAHYVTWDDNGPVLTIVSSTSSNWTTASVDAPTAGTWSSFVARFFSDSDKQIYVPGDTAPHLETRTFGAPTNFIIGAYGETSGAESNFFDGDIADFAVVNVGTDAWHRTAFFAGFSPRAIFPAHQIIEAWDFFGLTTNEPGIKGNTLTPNGTPARSDHGGAYYYPTPQQMGWLNFHQGQGGGGGGGQGGGHGGGNGGGNGGGGNPGGGPPGQGGGGNGNNDNRFFMSTLRKRRKFFGGF